MCVALSCVVRPAFPDRAWLVILQHNTVFSLAARLYFTSSSGILSPFFASGSCGYTLSDTDAPTASMGAECTVFYLPHIHIIESDLLW